MASERNLAKKQRSYSMFPAAGKPSGPDTRVGFQFEPTKKQQRSQSLLPTNAIEMLLKEREKEEQKESLVRFESTEPVPVEVRTRETWETFSDTTGFEGFKYMMNADNRFEFAVWVVIIAIAVALTIRDVSGTIIDYMNEPTTTEIKMVNEAKIILKPTFCTGLHPTKLSPKEVWTNATRVEAVLSKFERDDVFNFLSNLAYKDDDVTDPDLKLLIGLTTQMFINLFYIENSIKPENETTVKDWHYGLLRMNDDKPFIDQVDSRQTMRMVHDFYDSRNISFPELVKVIGALMCKNLHLEIRCHVNSENYTHDKLRQKLCQPERVLWLGYEPFNAQGHFLCLNATDPDKRMLNFQTGDDVCTVRVRPQDMWGEDYLDFFNSVAYLDFSGGRALTRSTINNIVSGWGQMNVFYMTVHGLFTSISTVNSQCSEDLSYLDCRGWCKAQWMMEHCKCYPVSWAGLLDGENRKKPDDIPFCSQVFGTSTGQEYYSSNSTEVPHLSTEECFKMQTSIDPDAECANECSHSCEQFIYGNELRKMENKGSKRIVSPCKYCLKGGNHTTGFTLKFDTFVYPHFTEKLEIDDNELFNRLGGNFNFWAGPCIVTIYALFVLCIKMFIHFVEYRRERRALANLKEMEISMANSELKPSAILLQLLYFYKSQAVTALLTNMVKKAHESNKTNILSPENKFDQYMDTIKRRMSRSSSMQIDEQERTRTKIIRVTQTLGDRIAKLERGIFKVDSKDTVEHWKDIGVRRPSNLFADMMFGALGKVEQRPASKVKFQDADAAKRQRAPKLADLRSGSKSFDAKKSPNGDHELYDIKEDEHKE